ncbi:MAG TPA: RNA chaperone Hfq [Microvirga sp.]|nr:RNA chaperone Hfq [Microvirga sp.]
MVQAQGDHDGRFLRHLQDHKVAVTMILANGVKLQGYVTAFDSFCVLLTRDSQSQIIYKQAISTIQPLSPIQLLDGAEEVRKPS